MSGTGDLTVTKVGTFQIKVTTEAVGNYAAGEATATLTVNKGSFTATVSMSDYAQGGTPRELSVSGNKSGGTVTYYYNTTNTTSTQQGTAAHAKKTPPTERKEPQ